MFRDEVIIGRPAFRVGKGLIMLSGRLLAALGGSVTLFLWGGNSHDVYADAFLLFVGLGIQSRFLGFLRSLIMPQGSAFQLEDRSS